ncbi:MAG: type IV pilin protein [Methylococcales bacterium]
MKTPKQRGFTLLELMVTVAIVGILAGVAYPAYQGQIRATRRADAQADLLQLASFMERFFTENSRYDRDMAGANVVLPFSRSPQSGSTIAYNLALNAVDQTSYTLRATPANVQAGDGYLELLDTGVRGWDTDNNNVIGTGESDWEK